MPVLYEFACLLAEYCRHEIYQKPQWAMSPLLRCRGTSRLFYGGKETLPPGGSGVLAWAVKVLCHGRNFHVRAFVTWVRDLQSWHPEVVVVRLLGRRWLFFRLRWRVRFAGHPLSYRLGCLAVRPALLRFGANFAPCVRGRAYILCFSRKYLHEGIYCRLHCVALWRRIL